MAMVFTTTQIYIDSIDMSGDTKYRYLSVSPTLFFKTTKRIWEGWVQRHEINRPLGLYSQHFIFIVTYEWGQ